jgi:hypothetical protein
MFTLLMNVFLTGYHGMSQPIPPKQLYGVLPDPRCIMFTLLMNVFLTGYHGMSQPIPPRQLYVGTPLKS